MPQASPTRHDHVTDELLWVRRFGGQLWSMEHIYYLVGAGLLAWLAAIVGMRVMTALEPAGDASLIDRLESAPTDAQ